MLLKKSFTFNSKVAFKVRARAMMTGMHILRFSLPLISQLAVKDNVNERPHVVSH